MFKMDFNDCQSFDLLPEGDYEVIIEDAKVALTQAGKEHIQLTLKVRDDIATQKYGKRLIFHKLWKRLETNNYSLQEFNSIGKACKLLNGKEYKTLNELLDDYKGKNCKVTIKHHEYNGKTYESITKWDVSGFDAPFGTFPEANNEEIPF